MTNKYKQRIEKFCRAYVVDLNTTKAALAAGYSARSAASQGSRLLKKAKVAARIAQLQQKQIDKLEITADGTLRELYLLAHSNVLDYVRLTEDGQADVDLSKLTRDQAAAIQEITVDTTGGTGDGERRKVLRTRFKLADKGINLERLGRHLKLFTDKIEATGKDGAPLDVTVRLVKADGESAS